MCVCVRVHTQIQRQLVIQTIPLQASWGAVAIAVAQIHKGHPNPSLTVLLTVQPELCCYQSSKTLPGFEMNGQMFCTVVLASIKPLQFSFFQKLSNCLFILLFLLKCHPSDLLLRSPLQPEFLNPHQAVFVFPSLMHRALSCWTFQSGRRTPGWSMTGPFWGRWAAWEHTLIHVTMKWKWISPFIVSHQILRCEQSERIFFELTIPKWLPRQNPNGILQMVYFHSCG